jgi:hypothetical protein
MIEPRSDVHRPKASEERTYHAIVSPSGGANDAVGAPAGRSAYRDDYQRDHGPDLDEPFDEIESVHEFLTAALQAARY